MRVRVLLAAAVLLGFVALAAAQEYQIRVTHNTNLRASYSLEAAVVETVSGGTTLEVIGSYNRWLKISRNSEVWMADWVSHTRVEEQAPIASDIDNCCFVDRQCTSDKEWTDGYWAFQNAQCTAPAQTSTSTQPASSDIGQGNNCCQFGWHCQSDAHRHEGFSAFQENRCKHPGIVFEGIPRVIARVEAALGLLRTRAPRWYDYAVAGYDRIVGAPDGHIVVKHHADEVLQIFTPENVFPEERGFPSGERALIEVASTVIHDACHGHRQRAGLVIGSTLESERRCLTTEVEAMEVYAPDDPLLNYMRHILENIENIEYQWWH